LNLLSEITRGNWVYNYGTGQFDWMPDETRAWPLHVSSANPIDKTVTIKFNGSPSGDYAILLFSK
jgi:hypothetical protein